MVRGEWFSALLDRIVLAMALAGAEDDTAMVDQHFAEGVVAVYNEYFGRPWVANAPWEPR